MSLSLPKKKKVLFLTLTSMNLEPIVNSLSAIKEFSDNLLIDWYKFDGTSPHTLNELLLELYQDVYKPDLVVYIGPSAGEYLPSPRVFSEMSLRTPVVCICGDGGCPEWHNLLKIYRSEKCFTTIVNIDGNPNWPKTEKDLTLWCPIDHRYYEDRKELSLRNIKLGFKGSYASYGRRKIVEALDEKDLVTLDPRNETLGSYQQYADFLLECQMVLNIAMVGSEKAYHLKARVLESGWASCCLLEQKGSIAPLWFDPNKDYFEWETLEDIISLNEKLTLSDKQERANNLHRTVRTRYSAKHFWSLVFKAAGFDYV